MKPYIIHCNKKDRPKGPIVKLKLDLRTRAFHDQPHFELARIFLEMSQQIYKDGEIKEKFVLDRNNQFLGSMRIKGLPKNDI